MKTPDRSSTDRAKEVFRRHRGILRTGEALRNGIHPRTLYALRSEGTLVGMARGLYRLADLPPLGNPDLATVALKVPGGVICLISALAHHELTTQVPHEVHLALPQGWKRPHLAHPPLRVFRYDAPSYKEGIEHLKLDGVSVRIYSPEKTLGDCFKFRNKIGLDVALEALKTYMGRRGRDLRALAHYAKVCRVERVMRPYLETLL
jgi:predicted transcriptional regulator of viral defense system